MALAQDVAAEVQSLIATAIEAALKPVHEKVDRVGDVAAKAHEAAAALKPEEIQAQVTAAATKAAEAVAQKSTAEILKARDDEATKAAAAQADAKKKQDARAAFLAENAAKIPPAYLAAVPESDDPKVLAAALEKAKADFVADAGKFNFKLPDLGTATPKQTANAATPKTDAEVLAMSPADRAAYLATAGTKS